MKPQKRGATLENFATSRDLPSLLGTLQAMDMESAVERLAIPLLRYCRGRTGCPDLGQEVAQEALRILVERWRKKGPPQDPAAFAFAVARRRAGRQMARRALMRPLEILRERSGTDPDPAAKAELRSELRAATDALRRLPPNDREVLMLALLGDLSRQQIAELLGVTVSAVKMRLLRARRRLAAELEVRHELA